MEELCPRCGYKLKPIWFLKKTFEGTYDVGYQIGLPKFGIAYLKCNWCKYKISITEDLLN